MSRVYELEVTCCYGCPEYDYWDRLCKATGNKVEDDEVIAPHCTLKEA